MRCVITIAAVLATSGCSFVGVKGPNRSSGSASAAAVNCTDSGLLPSLDAIGGALAISTAGGGIIVEQTSEENKLENFTRYYAGPVLAVAIVYWIAASYGTNRITWCEEAKEKASRVRPIVIPIDPDATPKPKDSDIEIDVDR